MSRKFPGVDRVGNTFRARWYNQYGDRCYLGGFYSAQDASRYREERKAEIATARERALRNGYEENPIPRWTMDEAFAEWIEVTAPDLAESSVRTRQRNYAKHIQPMMGHYHPRKVTPEIIRLWQQDRIRYGLSATTVRSIRSNIFSGLFKWMIANRDRTYTNPLNGVKSARPTEEQMRGGAHRQDPTRVLSKDQVIALYEAMEEVEPRFLALLELGLNTGLRPGELFGIKPEVIDTERGVISVERRIIVPNGTPTPTERLKGEPETTASRREVYVPADVIVSVQAHVDEYGLSDEGYVFSMPNGKMIDAPAFANRSVHHKPGAFVRAARLAGLETHPPTETWKNVVLYTMRHTNISWRSEAGQSVAFIQAQVGHVPGSRVTFKHYVRVVPGTERTQVVKVESIMARREIAPVIPLRAG
jgi:integrase